MNKFLISFIFFIFSETSVNNIVEFNKKKLLYNYDENIMS